MHDIFLLSPWVDIKYKMAITSLSLIKYYLEDHGYDARIIDCAYYPQDLDDVIAILAKSEKSIIGITAYTRERFHAYDLIRKIRAEIPDSLIVVGGRHFGFLPEETLLEMPEVDIVVRGEGEITFKEICDAVYSGGGFEGIMGLSYRSGGTVVHNDDRPLEDNLDIFRSYDVHHKSDLNPKNLLSHTKIDGKNFYFSVHATRGCPNKCVYCSLKSSKVRYRSIYNVIKEIEDKIETTGVRNVSFTDSSLTINNKYITKLCNAIIEKKLDIRWRCYSRVNIDIEILKLMKKAGLDSVEIGLETGSPKILKAIRKNIKLEQVEKFCKLAHELGIKVWAFCMVSLPEETLEDANMTIAFVNNISKYITNTGMQTTRITPDASLCQIAKDKGVIERDFSWFKPYATPHWKLTRPWDSSLPIYVEHLTIDDINKKHDEFKRITSTKLANFSSLYRGIKYNLRLRALRRLTPMLFARKIQIVIIMLINSIRNMKKM